MGVYEELSIPRLINAMGTFTIYGGSKMSQQTLADMADAASSFIDIRLLQQHLSERTAALTQNEAAFYCCGAAAGIYLSSLAAIATKSGKKLRHLTQKEISSYQILIFRSHRNPYDIVFQQLGIELLELAYSNHALISPKEDIENVLTERTAAIFYLESGWIAPGAPSLSDVIQAAHQWKIPVILDAAAMLPPVENLWNYTQMGVDLVIFSGGKDLHGPQASGLILGRSFYINCLLEFAFPSHGYGRMLKIGREEMIGLYSALKQFLTTDHHARLQDTEAQVTYACNLLSDHPLYAPERSYPNEAGQPIPRVRVWLLDSRFSSAAILSYLKDGSPSIIGAMGGTDNFYLNPMSLTMDEMVFVCQKLLSFPYSQAERKEKNDV